ncbi:MAG TPA: ribonuclease III [Myxococcota bacterium]|nr:ribonuclease III [Myxococcota bacterium]
MTQNDDTHCEGALAALDLEFADPALLELALAHPSYSHEREAGRGNERLEFLGDAVLDLVVAQALYEAHPDWDEGDLTRTRAALVNQRTLAERARELELGRVVKLGRTEMRSGGADKDSILANCFEAIVGAIYLDAGLARAEAFVRRAYGAALASGGELGARDEKTAFQEWAHAQHRETPSYRTVADSGVEDDAKRFRVEVALGGEIWGRGAGRSKRGAERAAAADALQRRATADSPARARVERERAG